MNNSLIYSLDSLSISQWFDMLANQKLESSENLDLTEKSGEQEGVSTYVYEVHSDFGFAFNTQLYCSGVYYVRISKEEAEELSSTCKVRKFSFSEIVLLSDAFSSVVAKESFSDEDIDELLEKGVASQYFEVNVKLSTRGLEAMREKVWTKYFEEGMMGIIHRVISAIANFFFKYLCSIDTDIDWPGDSCNYADQVINRMNRVMKGFLDRAYEASKEFVSERLEIPLDEFKEMEFDTIKTLYRKKALQLHPDKNTDPAAVEKFQKINSMWACFVELHRLKEQLDVDLYSNEEDLLEGETSPKAKEKSYTKMPLATHQFKEFLALPAPLPLLAD